MSDLGEGSEHAATKAEAWRRRLGLGARFALEGLEMAASSASPAQDRIAQAREEMRRVVLDQLGGDAALLEAVERISLSSEEAVALIEQADRLPSPDHFMALEAIVAFDGTRPSFLVKEDRVDFASSSAAPSWRVRLEPLADEIARFSACVGRVELGSRHIGTAFLIAPTLALTNRHVAQAVADFSADQPALLGEVFLDFGREHGGRDSHDRRPAKALLLAGAERIATPISHARLDLALLEVAPSTLPGEQGERFLPLSAATGDLAAGVLAGVVGYPAAWEDYVPTSFRTQYREALARLLGGDGGTKRFAPGETDGMLDTTPRWSAMHDATTINGNSGSPMALLARGPLSVAGLHYGGAWGGERTNWAHVLANCGEARCVPGNVSLAEGLARHGIAI